MFLSIGLLKARIGWYNDNDQNYFYKIGPWFKFVKLSASNRCIKLYLSSRYFGTINKSKKSFTTLAAGLSPNRRLVIRGGLGGDGGMPWKECSGLDRNGFNKLNKICDDCFALFKEPEIYTLCRWPSETRLVVCSVTRLSYFWKVFWKIKLINLIPVIELRLCVWLMAWELC